METLQEQQENKRGDNLTPFQWKKGQSGNPKGRPVGRSIKERAKAMLASMTNDEFEDFLHGLDKKTIWEMAEGKASSEDKLEIVTPNITISEAIANKYDFTSKPEQDSK